MRLSELLLLEDRNVIAYGGEQSDDSRHLVDK
jgi:hypothetical protein